MKKNILLLALLIGTLGYAQKAKRTLVWEENFDGAILNQAVWNYELGDGCPDLCGWGNNERQIYTETNHSISDGKLSIHARKEGAKYTSTKISTKGKKEFRYGRVEARAKLGVSKGLLPAFWMLGSNISSVGWPKSGEIDILEYVGKEPEVVFTSLHTQDSHGNTINTKKTTIPNIEVGFHVYAIEWTKDKIEFFVDDESVYTFAPAVKNVDTWPFDQPFYIIVNLAVGGNFWGPEVDDGGFPEEFVVDYFRVYA